MPAGTFLPPGLTTSDVKITSGGTDNYVMTAVDGETIQGEIGLQFDGNDLTVATDVGIIFSDSGQKIESDGTDLTIASGAELILLPTNDVLIGGSTPITVGGLFNGTASGTPELQVAKNSTISNMLLSTHHGTVGYSSTLAFLKSANTSIGSFTTVADDEDLGNIVWTADDGADYVAIAARIFVEVDGAVATNQIPGRISFMTTPAGSVNPETRMKILSTGEIDFQSNSLGITNVGDAGNEWNANQLILSNANAGAKNAIEVYNTDNGNGASRAVFHARTGGSDSGDAYSHYSVAAVMDWAAGLDESNSNAYVISASADPGTYDALQITAANPPIITYNTNHPTGVFDYVCDSCGKADIDSFECCGLVAWHDDVLALREMALNRDGLQHMAKLGVMKISTNNDGSEWLGINMQAAQHFTWSGMYQLHQRMDAQHQTMDERLKRIEQALGV